MEADSASRLFCGHLGVVLRAGGGLQLLLRPHAGGRLRGGSVPGDQRRHQVHHGGTKSRVGWCRPLPLLTCLAGGPNEKQGTCFGLNQNRCFACSVGSELVWICLCIPLLHSPWHGTDKMLMWCRGVFKNVRAKHFCISDASMPPYHP